MIKTKEEYQSELRSLEWKHKREDILTRDGQVCQSCFNKKYLLDNFEINSFQSSLVQVPQGNSMVSSIQISSVQKRLYYCDKALKKVPKGRKKGEKRGYAAFTISNQDSIILQALFTVKPIIDSLSNNEYGLTSEDIRAIAQTNPQRINWHYAKNLNIHHHYYLIGAKAWEYPNEALITYCSDCHLETHGKLKIPVFDKDGNKLEMELTTCSRCGGTGYMPEFNHVQAGICFKCRGARYEEFSEKLR
ncbi:hypothetical protein [Spirosoma oryzicola]|uniref:hypothetical protein n=1 Tax=Spirosoma oryzicola TaxID=2898794 RepID=UPI001E500B1E|nr:hypothetical protein [Spirosoma oryzicola]UHG93330.1 hypothetical protein LQ777_10600 [Spirosoma oryzicola]